MGAGSGESGGGAATAVTRNLVGRAGKGVWWVGDRAGESSPTYPIDSPGAGWPRAVHTEKTKRKRHKKKLGRREREKAKRSEIEIEKV